MISFLAAPALAGLLWLSSSEDPLEQALWERVQTEDAVPVFELYLQLFPKGSHAIAVWERWFDRTHRGDPNLLFRPSVPVEEEV